MGKREEPEFDLPEPYALRNLLQSMLADCSSEFGANTWCGDSTARVLRLKGIPPYNLPDTPGNYGPIITLGSYGYATLRKFQKTFSGTRIGALLSPDTIKNELIGVLGYCHTKEPLEHDEDLEIIREMLVSLRAQVSDVQVIAPVYNTIIAVSGFKLGTVEFWQVNAREKITDFLLEHLGGDETYKQQFLASQKLALEGAGQAGTVAATTVRCDIALASELGHQRISEALDLLRCLANRIHERWLQAQPGFRSSLAVRFPVFASRVTDRSWTLREHHEGPIGAFTLHSEALVLLREECALEEFSAMLAKPMAERTDLEVKLASAISWAARGIASHDPAEAVLNLCIALEVLFTGNNRGDITGRLAQNIAFLLRKDATERRALYKRVHGLYALRSDVVHRGKAAMAFSDLVDLEEIALETMIRLVRNRNSWRNSEDVQAWVLEQMFS